MAPLTVDSVIDAVPSWGYPLMLVVAFSAAIFLSGVGMRLLSGLLQRVRRTPAS